MTEDEMVGWHHQFNGHEFEQTPGDGKGQGSLACCSPWRHQESDMTEQLNNQLECKAGFPSGISGKESAYQCRRHKRYGFNPWIGKIL